MDGLHGLGIDAVPHRIPVKTHENTLNKINIENLLSDFSIDDYKSALFLLMDYVKVDKYLDLTKKDESFLKNTFIELYHTVKNDSLLVELLGILKMYKKLRMLGTCCHVYESDEKKFNQIDRIWKVLYSLCEELTDDDLKILKRYAPPNIKDQILSTEDWFCWALQNKLFSRTDLLSLENIFTNYPQCLNIIKSYKDSDLYDVLTPTSTSNCGIALILNYDKFNENTGLKYRENSYKDVNMPACSAPGSTNGYPLDLKRNKASGKINPSLFTAAKAVMYDVLFILIDSLVKLWNFFGFKTDDFSNLTYSQTIEKMKCYASKDHSNYSAFVCCILSHGQSNAVYSSDGKLIPNSEIIGPIVNDCLSLNKKPKLFFIQACQGTNMHEGPGKPIFQINMADTPATKSSMPLILCDGLIVNSTIDGFVSFRDSKGSWFIQTLCELLMQYGEDISVEEVMTKVTDKVAEFNADLEIIGGPKNALQTVLRSSTLGKKLILKKRIV